MCVCVCDRASNTHPNAHTHTRPPRPPRPTRRDSNSPTLKLFASPTHAAAYLVGDLPRAVPAFAGERVGHGAIDTLAAAHIVRAVHVVCHLLHPGIHLTVNHHCGAECISECVHDSADDVLA